MIEFVKANSPLLAQLLAWHENEALNMGVGAGKGNPGRALARQALVRMATEPPEGTLLLVAVDGEEPVAYVLYAGISDMHKRADIHIAVNPKRWGEGIGKEVLRMAIDRAFEKGLYRIEFSPIQNNKGGVALAESVGLVLEAIKRSSLWLFDGPRNQAQYRMTRPEWKRLREQGARDAVSSSNTPGAHRRGGNGRFGAALEARRGR